MIKGKTEQYTCKGSVSYNFVYIVDQIDRSMRGGCDNQSLGRYVNQAATQLLHNFTPNKNI
jgi:hypothetical protein